MARNDAFGRVRLWTGLVLFATFAAGTLVGAGVHHWMRPPHRHPSPPMHLPLEELDLTPEQSAKAHAILDSHHAELETILRGTFPRVRAIHAQIESEVRAILTPAQRTRLDEIEASRPSPPLMPMGGGGPPPPPHPQPHPQGDRNE